MKPKSQDLMITPTLPAQCRINFGRLQKKWRNHQVKRKPKSQDLMITPTLPGRCRINFGKLQKKWKNHRLKRKPKNLDPMKIRTLKVPCLMLFGKPLKKWPSPHQKKISSRTHLITKVLSLRDHRRRLKSQLQSQPPDRLPRLKPLKFLKKHWLTSLRNKKEKTEERLFSNHHQIDKLSLIHKATRMIMKKKKRQQSPHHKISLKVKWHSQK